MKKNKQIVNLLLEYGIAVVLLLLIIIFATQSSNFLSVNTVMTILKQVSITGIISVGMTFVILTGGTICRSVQSPVCPVLRRPSLC